jgi:hypothetical protein
MPNHTYTEVTIQGSHPTIDAFHGKLTALADPKSEDNKGFLTEFLGDPADKYDPADWYDARIQHWGSKWDVYDIRNVSIDSVAEHAGFEASRIVKCHWHSAWSPPIPALCSLSSKYNVDIHIKYLDEGLFYAGQTTIFKGEPNLVQDYDGEDVYRGVYEVFGKKFFTEMMYEMDTEYLKSILKLCKQFADKQTISKLKQIIKAQAAA